MPINNNLFGIYKTLRISGNYILAKSATRTRTMTTEAVQLLQGTPKSRIYDIAEVKETFKIDGPLLIGGASSLDTRQLLLTKLQQALNPSDTTLPLITSSSIEINKEGANVSVGLMSDGNPANSAVFEVRGADPGAGTPLTLLDPTGTGGPTRVAKWYDFRVDIGGYKYYVQECKLDVQVKTQEAYFIAGYDTSLYANPASDPLPTPSNPYNWGTQYPTFGISSINIEGDCKAVVLLQDLSNPQNYDFLDLAGGSVGEEPYAWETGDEALNINWGSGDLTYQAPGQAISAPESFRFEIFVPTTGWVDLLKINPTDSSPVVDLSKSLITDATLNVNIGLITVALKFKCWVK